jgi:hypothetical protein
MEKREAAEYLGVSTRTLERYAAQGLLVPRRKKGKTRPITVFDQAELERLKSQLESSHKVEVFGRPNTPAPRETVGFRLDSYYMKRLEEVAKQKGMSPGDMARRMVIRSIEAGDDIEKLTQSIRETLYLLLVGSMGVSEAEADDIVRRIGEAG